MVNFKAGISLIAIFLAVLLIPSIAFAALDTIIIVAPANATEMYDTTALKINVTTNQLATACMYFLEQDTTAAQTGVNMTNSSTNNMTWTNSSVITITNAQGAHVGELARNVTYKCVDGSNTAWLNTSTTAGHQRFIINERAANGVNITLNQTDLNIWTRNYTEFFSNQPFQINASTDISVAKCWAYIDWTATAPPITTVALTNYGAGANHTKFANSSAVTWYPNGSSTFIRNLTVMCQDTWGNKSWLNGTASHYTIFAYYINEWASNSVALQMNTSAMNTIPKWINNKGEYFSNNPFGNFTLNISADRTVSYCNMYDSRGTLALTNQTNRTAWINTSSPSDYPSNGFGYRNLTYACTDAWGNISWLNGTGSEGQNFTFKINERKAGAISISAQNISNATNYTIDYLGRFVNISLNTTASNCQYLYNFNLTAAVQVKYNMSNTSLSASMNHTNFTNSTSVVGEHEWANVNNITWFCNDSFGNISWYNSSATSGFLWFGVDLTAPTVSFSAYNMTVINNQSLWNMTFNYTDINPYQCGLDFYWMGQNVVDSELNATRYTYYQGKINVVSAGTGANGNCTAYFNASANADITTLLRNMTGVARFKLSAWGNDTYNHQTASVANITGLVYRLYSGNWSAITWVGNNNTDMNATYIEWWNNTAGNISTISYFDELNGTWITFSRSAPTINQNIVLYAGKPVFLLPTADTWLFMPDYSLAGKENTSVSIYRNGTIRNSSWNMIGLLTDVKANSTLYTCNWNTTTLGGMNLSVTPSRCNSTFMNISYMSYFNSSTGLFQSCKMGSTLCSGTNATAENIVLPKGSAIWLLFNITGSGKNISVNRSSIVDTIYG